MPSRAVCDHCMRDAVLAQLPGSKLRTLIPGSRLSNPNMNRQLAIVGRINRGRGRAVINKREPSRVAMRENVDRLPRLLSSNLLNEIQSMLPYHPAVLFVFVCDQSGCAQSQGDFLFRSFPIGDIL